MFASVVAILALAAAPYEEGQVLTYEGSFQPVKVDKPDAGKSFELTVLIGPAEDGKTSVYWLLGDSGRNPIPWAERFDKLAWSPDAKTVDGPLPGFMYDHASGKTRVNIAAPLPLFSGELKAGSTWNEGKTQFEVNEGEAVDGQPTWDVVARTLVGRRRIMAVDRDDQRVYSLRENVFVGQGEEHLLKYTLVSAKTLDSDALKKAVAAAEAWSSARSDWTSEQSDRTPKKLAAANKDLVARLPDLKKASERTSVAALAAVVAAQLKNADEQQSAVGALRSKVIGKPLPTLDLKDVANKTWSNDSLQGKVTVLHFWSYRDENLREPYGQVGYLDFLARQNTKVQVLGIAVVPDDPEQKPGLRAQVRKFRDFMNVSYPILLDDGALLKKLGDPRQLKQELPLFVVVDGRGNVVEYKAGEYDVKANEGLKELEGTIKQAAKPAE